MTTSGVLRCVVLAGGSMTGTYDRGSIVYDRPVPVSQLVRAGFQALLDAQDGIEVIGVRSGGCALHASPSAAPA